jgi:hypothetical protein
VGVEFRGDGELNLTFELAYPAVNGGQTTATIQFGGIKNYEKVAEFFRNVPQNAYMDGIVAVKERPNWVYFVTDRHGTVQIQCQHVLEF